MRSEYLANLHLAQSQPKRTTQRKNYRYYQTPIQLPMVRPGFILALGYVIMIAVGIKF